MSDELPGILDKFDFISAFGGVLLLLYLLSTQALGLIDPSDPIAQVAAVTALIAIFGEAAVKSLKNEL